MANLAALLDKEASAEIDAILSEARARASEIVAEAEAEAETVVASRERAAKAQHQAALVRAESSAQLEASSLRLRAQHRAVASVFDAAETRVEALLADPKAYAPVLGRLIEEAVDGQGDVRAVVVNPADQAIAEKALAAQGLAASVETDAKVRGGVRVRTGSNTVIENSLFERLQTLRDELASEVSATLFGDRRG